MPILVAASRGSICACDAAHSRWSPAGSAPGKTTLLRALLGLLPRDGGTIRWNGALIDDPATFLVPPQAAYTPQIPRLFSESLRDNILLGLPESSVDLPGAVRASVLERDLADLEDGLGTLVGPRGVKLSGGQVQRAGAARMLVRDADLLVVDDLSSALDVETERALWESIFTQNRADLAGGEPSTGSLAASRPDSGDEGRPGRGSGHARRSAGTERGDAAPLARRRGRITRLIGLRVGAKDDVDKMNRIDRMSFLSRRSCSSCPTGVLLQRGHAGGVGASPNRPAKSDLSGTIRHMSVEITNSLVQGVTQAVSRPNVRAILFDLDDTLFDHQHCSRAGLLALREGFPMLASEPFDTFELRYRVLLEEVHLLALSGELSPAAARLERFDRFLSSTFPSTREDAERAGGLYFAAFRAARRPVAGAVELLSHIRPHVQIGVVTNNVRHEQVEKLQFLGLDTLVDELVTSEEVGVAKPHPAIFHTALERLTRTPDEVVMVGDNWENDIVGASRVGIRSIWLNRYADPHLDETLAPQIVEFAPLEDVARLLLGHPRDPSPPAGA